MGVPQKSMVETEILKFGEAEEKIKKMNKESELKRREKGENGERYGVGPNNLWVRSTCSWEVQRPKPKKTTAQAQ